MTNRHVPLITGVVAVALAVGLGTWRSGWWVYLVGGFLLWYAVVCFKTAWSATDQEIEELTTSTPMSPETEARLKDRI